MNYKFAPALITEKLSFLYDFIVNTVGTGVSLQKKTLGQLNAKDGESILDVGCGTGTFVILAKNALLKSKIVGLDPDESVLKIAKKKAKINKLNVKFVKSGAENLPFPDSSFNHVVSSLAFHHMPLEVKKKALSEINRVLKPKGTFLLVDIGKPKNSFWQVIYGIESLIEVREYLSHNLKGKIPTLLEEANFNVIESRKPYLGIYFWKATK